MRASATRTPSPSRSTATTTKPTTTSTTASTVAPSPRNDPQLAFRSYSVWWDRVNLLTSMVELDAATVEVGSTSQYRYTGDAGWGALVKDLTTLVNAERPLPDLADPYKTVMANLFNATEDYWKAVANNVNIIVG